MSMPRIAVIGGPNSGKTHYAGQLYGRVRTAGSDRLHLRQTPNDLTLFRQVLERLEGGLAAEHTPIETRHEVILPLADRAGRPVDLRWPDYGGERLRIIERERAVSERWRSEVSEADAWLLFIRPTAQTRFRDALTELAETTERTPSDRGRDGDTERWDANARWVELLQMLLHVSGRGTAHPISRPRLAIALSCYDELSTNGPHSSDKERTQRPLPTDWLDRELPLLADFVAANWAPGQLSVWGLSALGRALSKAEPDDDFMNRGPEAHGWVIGADGEQDPDLCRPLMWLMEQA